MFDLTRFCSSFFCFIFLLFYLFVLFLRFFSNFLFFCNFSYIIYFTFKPRWKSGIFFELTFLGAFICLCRFSFIQNVFLFLFSVKHWTCFFVSHFGCVLWIFGDFIYFAPAPGIFYFLSCDLFLPFLLFFFFYFNKIESFVFFFMLFSFLRRRCARHRRMHLLDKFCFPYTSEKY